MSDLVNLKNKEMLAASYKRLVDRDDVTDGDESLHCISDPIDYWTKEFSASIFNEPIVQVDTKSDRLNFEVFMKSRTCAGVATGFSVVHALTRYADILIDELMKNCAQATIIGLKKTSYNYWHDKFQQNKVIRAYWPWKDFERARRHKEAREGTSARCESDS